MASPFERGPQGPAGPPGRAGADGNTLRSGTTAPDNDDGENDDFYLNTDTSELYGPKTLGSWGEDPISIIGATGADGRTIFSGSGAPSGGTGENGDFYIDTSAFEIYGPKAAGVWGSGTSLVGPEGDPGDDGRTLLNGTGAPGGGLGSDGDFYIDTAAFDIYGPKTAGVWGSGTSLGGGGFTPPTGTGFAHITSGVLDGAAVAVDLASAHVTGVLPLANSTAWVSRGAYASLPGAGTAGRLYFCSDIDLILYDSGAAWFPYVGAANVTITPAVSAFTAINAGGRTTTSTDSKGGIVMSCSDGTSAVDARLLKKTAPVTAYTAITRIQPYFPQASFPGAGLCVRKASDGSIITFGLVHTTGVPQLMLRKFTANNNGTSPTYTISGADLITLAPVASIGISGGLWFKFTDDLSATRTWSVSLNGTDWILLLSEARTVFITPDEIGIWIAAQIAAGGSGAFCHCVFSSFSAA